MDYDKNGILGTKHRLWKKKSTVIAIVDQLLDMGYTFKEVVIGEPNNFVFADHYEELHSILKKRGFYGIRIKVLYKDALLEINSNTDGVNNVQYTIFAEELESYNKVLNDIDTLIAFIKPSSDTVAQVHEYFTNHTTLRNTILLVIVGIILYFLGVHVFLFDLIGILFSFSPFLAIYILYILLRRKRY
jgi:hypothetical protein